MYFADLTPCTYGIPGPEGLSVGWLSSRRKFPVGDVPDGFVERLTGIYKYPVEVHLGCHFCDLCGFIGPRDLKRARAADALSCTVIRVVGRDGTIYYSPGMIRHYVTKHRYQPPEEFVRAVMETDLTTLTSNLEPPADGGSKQHLVASDPAPLITVVRPPCATSETHKSEPDEMPLPPIAQKDGSSVTLRCRTPWEAFLICDELEEADILSILPDGEKLLAQFERDGYVEVRVSAKAYESLADRRSTVEFQYKRPSRKKYVAWTLVITLAVMSVICMGLHLWFSYSISRAESWPTVDAVVSDCGYSESPQLNNGLTGSHVRRVTSFSFRFDYTVDGRRYSSSKLYANSVSIPDWIAREYPLGRHFMARYNPSNPAEAVAEPGTVGNAAFVLSLVCCGLTLLALVFHFREL
jgi:hypothetical protein